jgi:hypothetical protein
MRAWTIMATLAGFGLAACRGGPTTVPPNDSFRGRVSASDTMLDKDPRLAWVNKKGKQFLHDNLSDVALYGGTYRQVIRAAVEQALCSFIGGTPHPNSPKTCTGGRDGHADRRDYAQHGRLHVDRRNL